MVSVGVISLIIWALLRCVKAHVEVQVQLIHKVQIAADVLLQAASRDRQQGKAEQSRVVFTHEIRLVRTTCLQHLQNLRACRQGKTRALLERPQQPLVVIQTAART